MITAPFPAKDMVALMAGAAELAFVLAGIACMLRLRLAVRLVALGFFFAFVTGMLPHLLR